MKIKYLLFLYLILHSCFVFAAEPANIQDRYNSLISQVRCVVCQGQSIADSNAPLAADLRTKIFTMMANNESDEQIKQYLVQRYGEYILLQPRFNLTTGLLWLFPLIGLGIFTYFFFLRSNRSKIIQ